MIRSTAVPLVLGAAVLAAPLLAQAPRSKPAPAVEWPGFRGPERDALSPDTALLKTWKPGGPPLAWKASGLGTGYSSVAVAGGRVYTLGDKDGAQHLFALDARGGKALWSARVGAPWVDSMGGPRGTPTVDGDRVYAIGTE